MSTYFDLQKTGVARTLGSKPRTAKLPGSKPGTAKLPSSKSGTQKLSSRIDADVEPVSDATPNESTAIAPSFKEQSQQLTPAFRWQTDRSLSFGRKIQAGSGVADKKNDSERNAAGNDGVAKSGLEKTRAANARVEKGFEKKESAAKVGVEKKEAQAGENIDFGRLENLIIENSEEGNAKALKALKDREKLWADDLRTLLALMGTATLHGNTTVLKALAPIKMKYGVQLVANGNEEYYKKLAGLVLMKLGAIGKENRALPDNAIDNLKKLQPYFRENLRSLVELISAAIGYQNATALKQLLTSVNLISIQEIDQEFQKYMAEAYAADEDPKERVNGEAQLLPLSMLGVAYREYKPSMITGMRLDKPACFAVLHEFGASIEDFCAFRERVKENPELAREDDIRFAKAAAQNTAKPKGVRL